MTGITIDLSTPCDNVLDAIAALSRNVQPTSDKLAYVSTCPTTSSCIFDAIGGIEARPNHLWAGWRNKGRPILPISLWPFEPAHQSAFKVATAARRVAPPQRRASRPLPAVWPVSSINKVLSCTPDNTD